MSDFVLHLLTIATPLVSVVCVTILIVGGMWSLFKFAVLSAVSEEQDNEGDSVDKG